MAGRLRRDRTRCPATEFETIKDLFGIDDPEDERWKVIRKRIAQGLVTRFAIHEGTSREKSVRDSWEQLIAADLP